MNAHKSLGFLAAVLVTAGQALVLVAGTTAVAQSATPRVAYETTLSAKVSAEVRMVYGEADGRIAG